MVKLLHMMGEREGLGDILCDGVKVAAEKIGKGSDYYAMHVKGLELPAYDPRGAKAHGLGYATSYTGADHNKGYAIQEIFGLPFPYPVDRFAAAGKGALTMWNQDARTAVGDCPTMCIFMLDTSVAPFLFENTADLMRGATGLERVNNLARAFNTLSGLTRADDDLPERLKTEPIPEGPAKGQTFTQSELDLMLDEYYEARGWAPDGTPTRAKLEELSLGYAADKLGLA
jgi:aldehyde:ferredoxin oxidoreductase